MEPKYKIGEKVIYTNHDDVEIIATIDKLIYVEDQSGYCLDYYDHDMNFDESQILGRIEADAFKKSCLINKKGV